MKRKKGIRTFHLRNRFFLVGGIIMFVYAVSFALKIILPLAHGLLILFFITLLIDTLLLYLPNQGISGNRKTARMWSLGDPNPIKIEVTSNFNLPVHLAIYDELPFQLQIRDFHQSVHLKPRETSQLSYSVSPKTRGMYSFGDLIALARTEIGFISRLIPIESKSDVPTFPSIIQMKKYELMAFAQTSNFEGIKKVRRLGHSYEFEQIKPYVQGDDIRSVNWKATGRRNQLMVNQYEDERSQQVYTVIDKSRNMHMPFDGLTLLDYAINTSLVLSNIIIKKHDKAGLISYSDTIGSTIKAERSSTQLKKIMQALYNEKAKPNDANYDLLYRSIKNVVKTRSLIFLYLNFESTYNMERALPVLRKISKMHLLVVVVFENTELQAYVHKNAEFMSDIYTQTMAQKLLLDKRNLVAKMRKYGISTILSKPSELSINTVNKYLELKSRGLI